MAIEITNNGASIKINQDGVLFRNIMKNKIIEIVVIKDNIIKIDIGKGALYNVFIPFMNVTIPVTSSPENLKDAINSMLTSTVSVGSATEEKQLIEIQSLEVLNATADSIKTVMETLDSKLFFEPILIDESNPNLIYKGFAPPASNTKDAVWAIQRISTNNNICSYQWALGNKNFVHEWSKRETIEYL
jgi:hypothetical protein